MGVGERGRGSLLTKKFAELKKDRRGDGGQLKDRPMRGDLKAGVGFYEIGLNVTHLHAYADTCTDTGGEPETKACLIRGILMFLFINPQASL